MFKFLHPPEHRMRMQKQSMILLSLITTLALLYAMFVLPMHLATNREFRGKKRPFLARLAAATLIPWVIQILIVLGIDTHSPGAFSDFTITGILFTGWLPPVFIALIISLARAEKEDDEAHKGANE
jgi:hypothetical protein